MAVVPTLQGDDTTAIVFSVGLPEVCHSRGCESPRTGVKKMPIIYGRNLTRSWGEVGRLYGTILLKAYTAHTEKSEVFLSYRSADQGTALQLAANLDELGHQVFIDVHDGTIESDSTNIDQALVTAITKADTMVIVVSDNTQGSWWVPWEIGVSTPFQKPRAMYMASTSKPLPAYLEKLPRLLTATSVNQWVIKNKQS